MLNLSSLWKASIALFFVHLISCDQKKAPENLLSGELAEHQVDTFSILSPNKLQLTEEYALANYGTATYKMDTIKMMIVHFTVVPTLEQTLDLFSRDSLESNRSYINGFSPLNVGIHYVVDRDGSIYSLMPDTVMARHIIGFNHLSLGIENIARDTSELTDAQLNSNAWLIAEAKKKHPEMEYIIGHDEYNQRDLPHFKYYLSLNKDYKPYDKSDPGKAFMKELRKILNDGYGLDFYK